MKNLTKVKTLLFSTLLIGVLSAEAQKLPGVQKNSVYAPANVKVDGKATEWNNQYEALNTNTALYYTIANDGDKLYLTIHATDPTAINKMIGGGITFTVKSPEKAIKPVAVKYFFFEKGSMGGVQQKIKDPKINLDSVLTPVNIQMAAGLKEIGVKGVTDIADTLISAYNEYGIKEAATFDHDRALTIELAIPLKYLGGLLTADMLKYNIMLNGLNMSAVRVVINGAPSGGGGAPLSPAVSNMVANTMSGSSSGGFNELFNPTDFSGTYVLAKM